MGKAGCAGAAREEGRTAGGDPPGERSKTPEGKERGNNTEKEDKGGRNAMRNLPPVLIAQKHWLYAKAPSRGILLHDGTVPTKNVGMRCALCRSAGHAVGESPSLRAVFHRPLHLVRLPPGLSRGPQANGSS